MIEEITIKFGMKLKPTQYSWKSQLYTIDGTQWQLRHNEAVSKISIGCHNPYVILIKRGIYIEVVYIGKNKSNLVLIGEGMEKTIVQFNKSAKQCYEISRSATVGKVLFSYKSSNFCLFVCFFFFF